MIRLLDCLGLFSYCLFIYWLSDQPSLPAPMWFAHQDKVHHAISYAIMGLLAWRCLRHWLENAIILALLSAGFCSLYGVSDEWHQSFVDGRSADVLDWVADTFGAVLSMLVQIVLRNKAK